MSNLVILESGAKASTIEKFLGEGWIVQACNGHVQDLPSRGNKDSSKSKWPSSKEELPNPPWTWTPRAENIIKKIKKVATKSNIEHVYIATDPDREGEFIAWRLSIIFSGYKSIKRITFNEITEKAVNDAINSPKELDMALVEAAMVRRFMDRLVGFECSNFCRSWRLSSMGRVQTPTLGYIVEREIERDNYKPVEYHSIDLSSNDIDFKVRLHDKKDEHAWHDDGKFFPDRTYNKEYAKQIVDRLNDQEYITLNHVKSGQQKRKPQAPFTTDTMLQAANNYLGWSISKTSSVASNLYQNGKITYIRTDSTRTNIEARKNIRKKIEKEYGENFLTEKIIEYGSKNNSKVQDAHEAIRPTNPEKEEISGENDEKKLYNLIWKRFAASQMSDSVRERRSLKMKCKGIENEIYGTSSWRVHSGWEVVFDEYFSNIRTEPPTIGFELGNRWKLDDLVKLVTDFTKPPRRFSESSIIQKMKKDGIGRPSTYVSTISKLEDRNYITKNKGSLIPTENGRILWIDVVPYFTNSVRENNLFATDFTSLMESDLDSIEVGEVDAASKWNRFVDSFEKIQEMAITKKKQSPTLRQKQYIQNAFKGMDRETKYTILGSREIDSISGDDAKEIIDKMKEMKISIGASEKQIALIIRLLDKLSLDEKDVMNELGFSDISELTGGRDGTASTLIGHLIDLDNHSPATEKQKEAIIKMTDNLSVEIHDSLEIVKSESIDKITKKDASILIGILKKKISDSKKKKK